jgi:hypothetical protein
MSALADFLKAHPDKVLPKSIDRPQLPKVNNLIFIGGGGEAAEVPATGANSGTIFDVTVMWLGGFAKNSSYKVTTSFNGGHSATEALMNEYFSNADNKGPFVEANYNAILDDYIKRLQAFKDGSGPSVGQLMIYIDSHGSERSSLETTHSIAISPNGRASLDKLAEISKLAEETNTKLAILDMSCHSGNTLPLANSKTCVISAAGPLHYGYTTFSEALAARLKTGKNLENVFLEARNDSGGIGFPMISTTAGIAVQDSLYPLVTPYMYYHADTLPNGAEVNKIDKYLMNNSPDILICQREEQFKNLMDLLKNIEEINIAGKDLWTFTSLKQKIIDYKKIQDSYLKKIAALNMPDMNAKETFSATGKIIKDTLTVSYSLQELLLTDFDSLIYDTELDMQKTKPGIGLDWEEINLKLYKQAKDRKNALLQPSQLGNKLRAKQELLNSIKSDENLTQTKTFEIQREIESAYDVYYKNISKDKDQKANPCKDFVI